MRHFTIAVLAALVLCVAGLAASASPAAAQLYAADGGRAAGSLYRINPLTGAASVVGTIEDSVGEGYAVGGMAFDGEGTLYAITTVGWAQSEIETELLTINPATGEATLVAGTGQRSFAGDITFIDGTLYSFFASGNCVIQLGAINTTTGAVVCAGSAGAGGIVGGGLAYDATGEKLYASLDGVDGDLRTLDPLDSSVDATLSLDGVGGMYTGGQAIGALTYYNGTLYGIRKARGDDVVHLVTIDTTTGAVEIVGMLPPGVDALVGR